MSHQIEQGQKILAALWQQYIEVTPSAAKIHQLLAPYQPIINDHIALRGFAFPGLDITSLSQSFLQCGYQWQQDYVFPKKHLRAKHFSHPSGKLPHIFISELLWQNLSVSVQQILRPIMEAACNALSAQVLEPNVGRVWPLRYQQYLTLAQASEYAAWLAAWGFRANHFTVAVHRLTGIQDLAQLNRLLLENGFALNQGGGEIKGSASDGLVQSATLADQAEVQFSDRVCTIPSCFYEFAYRYPLSSGALFQGFVPESADRIFESTDRVTK
ncbi:DUF1338 domain-containing protein [Motilimonas pumila]|uniref:2-oxoadipate dioxygenase/decarboxylase n=1 Tax=Motilimonas pumila TaxID=2303987 RepID=A0A418YCT6_9GAMM|nr:DUF1338 domain-containing protein [Motilimonas pumila]RJG42337.1 DUF1338 domain-containing protein [Motilimonas pumila]